MVERITTPLSNAVVRRLLPGQEVLLTGTVYTMRDQAHKRMVMQLQKKQRLPFNIRGRIMYYCGPTQTPLGRVIGSCGPTTSSRMDPFTAPLLRAGLKGMIGKGARSQAVCDAIRRTQAVYFLAPAGCGALLAACVRRVSLVGYDDLGPEAIRRLEVVDFPLIVGVDAKGRSVL